MKLPKIAIPEPTSGDQAYNERSLPQYIRAVEAAGGTAVAIRLHDPPEVQSSLLADCSGILLPGSPADVDPGRYGEERLGATAEKDSAREAVDDLLLEDAFRNRKPLLAICFGLQSLNVWRRGTLLQDLPKPGPVDHQPGRTVVNAHAAVVTPETLLSQLIVPGPEDGTDLLQISVNSSHHQAVAVPGEGLTVAARSAPDGVIEALELLGAPMFVLGVQWHPERSYEQSATSRAIFSSFVDAARG